MPNRLQHTKMPLNALLAMLQAEGFTISTSTVLDIQKVLATVATTEIDEFEDLKLFLSPFICRNKEEQEKFNKVFEEYETFVRSKLEGSKDVIAEKTAPEFSYLKKRKIILLANIASILLMALLLILIIPGKGDDPPIIKISVEGNDDIHVVNEPVVLNSYLSDSLHPDKYTVNWQVNDSFYKKSPQLKTAFKDTGLKNVVAWIENKNGERLSADSNQVYIRCEKPPSVNILKDTTAADPAQKRFVSQLHYTAKIDNASSDTDINKYQYQWYMNDSPTVRQQSFYISLKNAVGKTIKVIVNTNGLHCSTDSLVALITETPVYDVSVSALKPLQLIPRVKWGTISLAVLGLFVLPVFLALAILFLRKKKQIISLSNTQDEEKKYTGPFNIEFKNQDEGITAEKEFSQLAESMRKRHTSDIFQLNLKKTIRQTIAGSGFPSLSFSPRTQPADFLAFIDQDIPQAHDVKLFEYIVRQLQREQVNITSYNFYKEPLLLSNDQLNHHLLPVDKVSRLYPDTMLFIFTNGNSFFQSTGTNLKSWVSDKFRPWKHKIIITTVPVNDWDYKEPALLRAGFTVVPADVNASYLVREEIAEVINRQKLNKHFIPANYSARFIDFDDWRQLKKYLGNDPLLMKWVCSLAVYPSIDWKITVALGKAIEEHSDEKKIVTYSNLLKLSRIRWMQTGLLKDEMRLEMLRQLDNNTESLARKKIVELLEEVKESIAATSFVKDEYNLNHTLNRFLLHTNNPAQNTLSEEEELTMKEYVKLNWLDYPLDKYLSEAKNTMLKNEGESVSVSPEKYFNLLDEAENKKQKREKFIRKALASAAVLAGLAMLYLFFSNPEKYKNPTQFADIAFTVSGADLPPELTEIKPVLLMNDNVFESEKASDSSFIFKKTPVGESGNASRIQLNTVDGKTIVDKLINLDSSEYRLSFLPPAPKKSLQIRYNNEAAFAAISEELSALLWQYEFEPAKENFSDSSRIVFYNQAQSSQVDSLAQLIKLGFNINIYTNKITSQNAQQAVPVLYLNLNAGCSNLPLNALPQSLTEIWEGKTNRRLIVIDLNRKIIYYSTGDKNSYGTYGIDEVCLGSDGVYKFITSAGNQYQVFLLKNIRAGSFELASCQSRFNTKEEALNIDVAICDAFNMMNLYFENDPIKIFFNYRSTNIAVNQKSKTQRFIKSNQMEAASYSYKATLFTNNLFTAPNINTVTALGKAGFNRKVQQANASAFKGTPFDRNFITIREEYKKPPDNAANNNEVYRQNNPVTLPVRMDTVSVLTGIVTFDEKNYPDNNGLQIIDRAKKVMAGNSIIKLVATIESRSDMKLAEYKLNTVKNLLGKSKTVIQTEIKVSSARSATKQKRVQTTDKLVNNIAIYELKINASQSQSKY